MMNQKNLKMTTNDPKITQFSPNTTPNDLYESPDDPKGHQITQDNKILP